MSKVIGYAWDLVKPGPWDLFTQSNDAQAPVLYNYSSSGFISPAPNRSVTIQDGTYINEYNQRVATRLQEQDTTLNQLLQQTMPNWQPVAKDLNFLSNPTANYSNEGRNYQTPTYSVGAQVETPAPVSYALTPGSLRGTGAATNAMPANSGVFASQMARNAAFEVAWAQALTEHSTPPAPTSFPTDPAAYVGLEDAFGSPVSISCIGITGNPQLMGDANSATNDANYRRYA